MRYCNLQKDAQSYNPTKSMLKQLLSLTTQAPGLKLVFGFESLSDSWLESIWKTNLQLLRSIHFYLGYKTQKRCSQCNLCYQGTCQGHISCWKFHF